MPLLKPLWKGASMAELPLSKSCGTTAIYRLFLSENTTETYAIMRTTVYHPTRYSKACLQARC